MSAKIERVNTEISNVKARIAKQQARLRELEKQRDELENLEIVETVRGMDISFTDLAALLRQAKNPISEVTSE